MSCTPTESPFCNDPSSLPPSGPAGGDLSGTYPDPSVVNDSHLHTAATLSGVLKLSQVSSSSASVTLTAGTSAATLTNAAPTVTLQQAAVETAAWLLTITGGSGSSQAITITAHSGDTINGSASVRLTGLYPQVQLVRTGTTAWQIVAVSGTLELPIRRLDFTTLSGAPPYTVTDGITGASVGFTSDATGTITAGATGIQATTPTLSAIFSAASGTGVLCGCSLASLGLTLRESWVIIGNMTHTGAWAGGQTAGWILGSSLAANPRTASTLEDATPTQNFHQYDGANRSVLFASGASQTWLGMRWNARARSLVPLIGAPSGTPGSTWWALDQTSSVDGAIGYSDAMSATMLNLATWSRVGLCAAWNSASTFSVRSTGLYVARIYTDE